MISLYRAKSLENNEFVMGEYYSDSINNKYFIRVHEIGSGYPHYIESHFVDVEIDNSTCTQFTGYEINNEPLFFGDKLSNNYGTDKEVIREIVEYEGCKMMKLIKGKSSLPGYIKLDEYYQLNYKIIIL